MKRFLFVVTMFFAAWYLQAPVAKPTAVIAPPSTTVPSKAANVTPPAAVQPATKPTPVTTATQRKPVVKVKAKPVTPPPVAEAKAAAFPNDVPSLPEEKSPAAKLQTVEAYVDVYKANGQYRQLPCAYYPWYATPGACDPKEPWFRIEPEDYLGAMLDDCGDDDIECVDFVQQMLVEALQVGLITNRPRHPAEDLVASMMAEQLYHSYGLTVIAQNDCGQRGMVFSNDRCQPAGVYR